MDASTFDKLYQRIQSLIGRGRITLVDDTGPVQEVQVSMNALDVPSLRYRVPDFGFSSNPPAGSDAILAHVAGDRSSGIVIGTNHQPSRPRHLAPGESMLYSQDGKYVYVTAEGGISVFANGQPVSVSGATVLTVTATEKVRMVTPRLECTGDIVDNCDSIGRSMVDDRVIYDGHTHPGGSIGAGTSGVPNQPE